MQIIQNQFLDILQFIKESRIKAIKIINTELIELYWNIGEYISKKVESSEWGQSVVKDLAEYIQKNESDLKGFPDKNLWRMKQFYETYNAYPKLSTVLREISWSHNLTIFSRCKMIKKKSSTRSYQNRKTIVLGN